MRTLASFIPDNIINALGWTIFHSLWQGLIIGLILLLIFKYRRDISSQTRYLLGVFALAAILTSSLFTFLFAYHPVSFHTETATFSSSGISSLAGIPEARDELNLLNPASPGWQTGLIRTFDIVSITWFMGVLLLALRLAGGMLVINGMRLQGVAPLPEVWERRLHMLALKTGLRRSVKYLQSQKVLMPMVVGIVRPVVLIPSMIMSGLPADQLETIIVHELGHIRRHDFLINIIQAIIEALFFYHPVVWIISENVRQEREKCCDDYTIKVCGKVSHYARALAHLSELQIKAVLPSVAITGNKKSILHRVERLIYNKKMKTNKAERLIAGLVLVTSVLVITLSTGATFKPSGVSPTKPAEESFASAKISLPSPAVIPVVIPTPPIAPADTVHRHHRDTFDIKDNTVTREFHHKDGEDPEMKFVIKQGKVQELYVDGQRIPENEFSRYQKEVQKLHKEQLKVHLDKEEMRREIERAMLDVKTDHKKIQEELWKAREEMKKAMEEFEGGDHELKEEDFKQAMEAMELGLTEVQEGMAKLQQENMQKIMDDAVKSVHEIDFEKIQMEIEVAMKNIEEIDFAEIEREMQSAMQNMEHDKLHLDKEKQHMDEMIEELDKLELNKK